MSQQIWRNFDVPLTPDEERERGQLLAQLLREKGRMEKIEQKRHKAEQLEIDKVQDRIDRVQGEILAGAHEVAVECLEYPDFDRGEVDIVRMDTGEVFERRPLTDADRQADLPIMDEPEEGPDGDAEPSEGVEAPSDALAAPSAPDDDFTEDEPHDFQVEAAREVVADMEATARAKPKRARATRPEPVTADHLDDSAFLGD